VGELERDNGACGTWLRLSWRTATSFVKTMKITQASACRTFILAGSAELLPFAMLDTKELLHGFDLNTRALSPPSS
jgi:hypothetical protein